MINFATGGSTETTVTLQLECVSCKHYFSVELPASELELPAQNHRIRRRNHNQPVECPRCHADNRYWLRILHLPRYFTALRQDWSQVNNFINGTIQWGVQFKMAVLALLFTVFMVCWVVRYHLHSEEPVEGIVLTILTFLTGVIMIFSVTGYWAQAREHRLIARYRQKTNNTEALPPHLVTGIKIFSIMALAVPLFVHLVVPGLNYLISPIISPYTPSLASRTQSLENTALELQKVLLAEKWEENEAGDKEEFETLISSVITQTHALALFVQEIPEFEEEIGSEPPDLPDLDPLRVWIKLLGVTAIGAFLLSYQGVNGYIRRVSPLLPPPIYVSVVKLTEVAIAEIQQTLRLPAQELAEIEWLDAKRNAQGGITLSGTRILLRDTFQNPRKVRTYVVETDEWGRVQGISTKNGNGHG